MAAAGGFVSLALRRRNLLIIFHLKRSAIVISSNRLRRFNKLWQLPLVGALAGALLLGSTAGAATAATPPEGGAVNALTSEEVSQLETFFNENGVSPDVQSTPSLRVRLPPQHRPKPAGKISLPPRFSRMVQLSSRPHQTLANPLAMSLFSGELPTVSTPAVAPTRGTGITATPT